MNTKTNDIVTLAPNMAVSLRDDPDFLGYIVGAMRDKDNEPTGMAMISISNPGKTGKRGCKPFPIADLVPGNGAICGSSPQKRKAGRTTPQKSTEPTS